MKVLAKELLVVDCQSKGWTMKCPNAAYSEKLSEGYGPRKVSLLFDVRVVVAGPLSAWLKLDQVPVVQLLNASFCDGSCASAFCVCGWQFCVVYVFFRKAYSFESYEL